MQHSAQSASQSRPEAADLADRILLCIPHGGLNNTLCQIDKCLRYAERFDRQLIVDATQSGLMGPFSDYFTVHTASVDVLGRLDEQHVESLNTFECHPEALRGRLKARKYFSDGVFFADEALEAPLSFDFSADYTQKLLVFEQSGGGNDSHNLLNRVSLADGILATVRQRLSVLPSDYLGIHVRNTDLETHYEPFFQDIYPATIGRNVLICSDDAGVIDHAKRVLDRAEIFTTATPQDPTAKTGRIPLHKKNRNMSASDRKAQAVDAIVDLLALGGASDVLFAKCSNQRRFSGYSRLASYLCRNKHVVASLLSSPLTLSSEEVRQFVITSDRADHASKREQRKGEQQAFLDTVRSERRVAKARHTRQREQIRELQDELNQVERRWKEKIQELEQRMSGLTTKLRAAKAANAKLRSTWSWKVTTPLRAVRAWTRRR